MNLNRNSSTNSEELMSIGKHAFKGPLSFRTKEYKVSLIRIQLYVDWLTFTLLRHRGFDFPNYSYNMILDVEWDIKPESLTVEATT